MASIHRPRSTLAGHSAVPRGTDVARMNANYAISNRSTRNARSMRTSFCVLGGRYDRQRTRVIRIAAITLAGSSAITIAHLRHDLVSPIALLWDTKSQVFFSDSKVHKVSFIKEAPPLHTEQLHRLIWGRS